MGNIKLIVPAKEYAEQVMNYRQEFINNNEEIHGDGGLSKFDNFDEWLNYNTNNEKEETVTKGYVPANTYLAIENDKMVGIINIRHCLNDFLLNYGGHIGYSVRKSERQKGYAKQMLKLALERCKELNIERALLTCDKNNIGSVKTIISNGGILENEVIENDKTTQRYWIDLK